jgi:hypothetical protein
MVNSKRKNYHGVDYFKFLLEDNFVSLKDFFIASSSKESIESMNTNSLFMHLPGLKDFFTRLRFFGAYPQKTPALAMSQCILSESVTRKYCKMA